MKTRHKNKTLVNLLRDESINQLIRRLRRHEVYFQSYQVPI